MSRTFLLQDWNTIRCTNAAAGPFIQDQEGWLDLDGFSDVSCWLDVSEVTPPGGTSTNSLLVTLETSPSFDDTYFAPAAPPVTYGSTTPFAVAGVAPIVVRSAKSATTNNLMRFLRWKITPSTTGQWDITFRIRAVATRSPAFAPTSVGGCVLWLRSDLGVVPTPGTNSVASWADQSGAGNHATAVTSPTYSAGGVNNLPKVSVASGQSMSGLFATNVSTHTLFCVLSYPSPLASCAAFAATDSFPHVNSGFAQFTETPTGIIGRAGASAASFGSAVSTVTTSLGALGIYSTAASSNSATGVDIWVNGVQAGTGSTSGITLALCPQYFLFQLGAASYPFVGDAYEFIVFNNVLSTSDRLRVHHYLGARYGIGVP